MKLLPNRRAQQFKMTLYLNHASIFNRFQTLVGPFFLAAPMGQSLLTAGFTLAARKVIRLPGAFWEH